VASSARHVAGSNTTGVPSMAPAHCEPSASVCVAGGPTGAIKVYDHAWELHPLVVDPDRQRSGIGKQLCKHLEREAAREGVLTLYLGADDDFGGTTLYGADLFDDTFGKIEAIAPAKGHAFTFYQKLGWKVVGVIPDANGKGKPDIMMAKRIG